MTRRLLATAAALAVGTVPAAALVAARAAEATTHAVSATVVSVYDGDTLTLAGGQRVRLLQIDTPELGSGECYSRAARTDLLHLVPLGSRVVLEADPGLDRVDRYGRLLRYVKRDGVNVNLELVRDGAAAPYFYGGDRGRYANALMAAATSAEKAKRGLWRACPTAELDPERAVDTGTSGPAPKKPAATGSGTRCDPGYEGACLDPSASDYDCAGGSGDGPEYTGPVRVVGDDHFHLDRDGDGRACET